MTNAKTAQWEEIENRKLSNYAERLARREGLAREQKLTLQIHGRRARMGAGQRPRFGGDDGTPPTDASPLSGAPVFSLFPVPDMGEGVMAL